MAEAHPVIVRDVIEIDGQLYQFEITGEIEVQPGPVLAAIMAALHRPQAERVDGEDEVHWRGRSVLEAIWSAGFDITPRSEQP